MSRRQLPTGRILSKLTGVSLIAIAGAYLCALIGGTRHQRFVFDDFEFAAAAERLGLVAQSKLAFYGFSGRTLLIIGGGASTSAGVRWAALIVALSILGLIVGGTVLLRRALNVFGPNNHLSIFASSLATIAICLGTLPAREQVLYWIIGALVYIAPMTLVVFGLCWVTQTVTKPTSWKHKRRWGQLLTALGALGCIAIGSGGNETVAPATVLGLVAIAAHTSKGSRMRLRALMALPCSLAGAAVVFGAPGQRARASWVPVHRSTQASIQVASGFWSAMSTLIVSNIPALFAAGFLGAFALSHLTPSSASTGPSGRYLRLSVVLCMITLADWIVLGVVASFGSMAVPPARAVTTPWCLTLISAACFGAAIRKSNSVNRRLTSPLAQKFLVQTQVAAPAFVMIAGIFFASQVVQTDND